ncbi:MAG: VWA domain-containing protein, partial [Pirellulales bacterium]|nr:VWA domain-containing protein [Pirellulales bacterium]
MPPQTNFAWDPPFPALMVIAILVSVFAIVMLVHWFGKLPYGNRRGGLLALRLAALAAVIMVLFGPTLVQKQLGQQRRSELFYLVDHSSSMEMGDEKSRWQQALSFVSEGVDRAGEEASQNTQLFRFGHRIAPLDLEDQDTALTATASDTRLADALRQSAARFGASKPAGLVVLSDGRVRSAEAVEQMARRLGQAGVPIHVVPIGTEGSGGDVAVISASVPGRVRKFSDCEVQVFLRSYGLSGKRTQVRVVNPDSLAADQSVATLASVPITLIGQAQAVSLPVHMDDRTKNLEVIVDPIEGETSVKNNSAT